MFDDVVFVFERVNILCFLFFIFYVLVLEQTEIKKGLDSGGG